VPKACGERRLNVASTSTTVHLQISELPKFKELYVAVHMMLVARLRYGQDSKEFLGAINRVIDAHDAIARTASKLEETA
jgi:hypothetical protein